MTESERVECLEKEVVELREMVGVLFELLHQEQGRAKSLLRSWQDMGLKHYAKFRPDLAARKAVFE